MRLPLEQITLSNPTPPWDRLEREFIDYKTSMITDEDPGARPFLKFDHYSKNILI